MVDDISDAWHGGTSNQFSWEKECGEKSPNFWQWVLQNPSFSNRIFLTFQNCGISHLSHFSICQYYSYGIEYLSNTAHVHGRYNLSILIGPHERVMISQTPGMGELQFSSGGRRNVEENSCNFCRLSFSKPFLFQMGYSQPSKILTFCIFYISVFVNTTANDSE